MDNPMKTPVRQAAASDISAFSKVEEDTISIMTTMAMYNKTIY